MDNKLNSNPISLSYKIECAKSLFSNLDSQYQQKQGSQGIRQKKLDSNPNVLNFVLYKILCVKLLFSNSPSQYKQKQGSIGIRQWTINWIASPMMLIFWVLKMC